MYLQGAQRGRVHEFPTAVQAFPWQGSPVAISHSAQAFPASNSRTGIQDMRRWEALIEPYSLGEYSSGAIVEGLLEVGTSASAWADP